MRNPTSEGWGIASIEVRVRNGTTGAGAPRQCSLCVRLACGARALTPAPHGLVSAAIFATFSAPCGPAALTVLIVRTALEAAGLAAVGRLRTRILCAGMLCSGTRTLGSGRPDRALFGIVAPGRGQIGRAHV